jgi:hypothetical protein
VKKGALKKERILLISTKMRRRSNGMDSANVCNAVCNFASATFLTFTFKAVFVSEIRLHEIRNYKPTNEVMIKMFSLIVVAEPDQKLATQSCIIVLESVPQNSSKSVSCKLSFGNVRI